MNLRNEAEAASRGLWSFSQAFYERPGVAAALLTLQDDAGRDVDLLLFAIWLGLSGRGRLDASRAEAAQRAVRILRHEVIEPLRALRRRLKAIVDDDVQRLRENIKLLEVEAERVALGRLAAGAGPISRIDPVICMADAEANFCLVAGSAQISVRPAAIIRRELQLFARNGR